MAIRAALVDMDGTVHESGIEWRALRREIGLPWDGRPILDQLAGADPATRERGTVLLHRAEAESSSTGRLIAGAVELLSALRCHGVRCALVTNNSRASAETVLDRHGLRFDLVLTRDDGRTKPEPHLLLDALRRLGVAAEEALVIGDAHIDAMAAAAAGIPEIVLVGTPEWMKEHIPVGVTYREASDLFAARDLILGLLGEPD